MLVMEVIVRLQDPGALRLSHLHNKHYAGERMVPRQLDLSSIMGKVMFEVGLVCLKSQWVPYAAVGFAWARCGCHGHGLQALDYLRNGRDHGEVCRRNSPPARGRT